MRIREFLYASSIFDKIKFQKSRDEWVCNHLAVLEPGSLVLDAGCGSQRYRKYCSQLEYRSQDFGMYTSDDTEVLETSIGSAEGYQYGALTYECDICNIPESDAVFDAVLCTEVLEHLPEPVDALRELVRVLKPGGALLLTAPTHSIKHMDPYHFYTGFTDRFYEQLSEDFPCELSSIEQNLDYNGVMALELARSMSKINFLLWPFLLPAFFIFYMMRESDVSKNAYTYGFHVILKKSER